jgi:VWFA-related protein
MAVPILASDLKIVLGEVNTDKFPEICFTISVKDSAGEKIENLDTSMVKVFEDSIQNNELIIQTLAESENQVAILIAVDASLSMAGAPIDSVRSAIKSFADQFAENDQVGILVFHDDVEFICPFTSNMDTLKSLADSIKAGGDTELYEGVYKGLDYLYEDKNLPKNKALIVLSDGKDEGTAYSDDEAIEKALEYGIPIFSIGYHTKAEKKYLRVLERMAYKTGGQYNDAPSIKDIDEVYDAVYEQIQAQQSICFTASVFEADSLDHTIHVNIVTDEGTGNTSLVFQSPSGKNKKSNNWLAMAAILILLVSVSYYINKRNKQKAEEEKQRLEKEKESLERELADEKQSQADKSQVQPDMTEKVEPDPRYTVISGRPGGQMAKVQFYFENGPLSGQSFSISDGMTIGRSDSNLLTVSDQTVSGKHAKIVVKGGAFSIVDLNSTNGTMVNGQKISEMPIKTGDKVQIGKVNITIR